MGMIVSKILHAHAGTIALGSTSACEYVYIVACCAYTCRHDRAHVCTFMQGTAMQKPAYYCQDIRVERGGAQK
jgi:hypothetical protein